MSFTFIVAITIGFTNAVSKQALDEIMRDSEDGKMDDMFDKMGSVLGELVDSLDTLKKGTCKYKCNNGTYFSHLDLSFRYSCTFHTNVIDNQFFNNVVYKAIHYNVQEHIVTYVARSSFDSKVWLQKVWTSTRQTDGLTDTRRGALFSVWAT